MSSGDVIELPATEIDSSGMVYAESSETTVVTRCGESTYQWAYQSIACKNLEKKLRGRVL